VRTETICSTDCVQRTLYDKLVANVVLSYSNGGTNVDKNETKFQDAERRGLMRLKCRQAVVNGLNNAISYVH
jgi:hypothetical protein